MKNRSDVENIIKKKEKRNVAFNGQATIHSPPIMMPGPSSHNTNNTASSSSSSSLDGSDNNGSTSQPPLKKRRLMSLPDHVASLVPESQILNDLQSFEYRLDKILSDKKLRMRQLLTDPKSVSYCASLLISTFQMLLTVFLCFVCDCVNYVFFGG